MKSEPHLLHGEAVSIDLALASVLAFQRKLLSKSELSRVLLTIRNLQLPIYHELCQPDFMYEALQDATIHRDGLQRMPLPKGIGRVEFVNDIRIEEIRNAIQVLKTN
jgi:3-dehydroquinate synthase